MQISSKFEEKFPLVICDAFYENCPYSSVTSRVNPVSFSVDLKIDEVSTTDGNLYTIFVYIHFLSEDLSDVLRTRLS
jgi:hypothetical protein